MKTQGRLPHGLAQGLDLISKFRRRMKWHQARRVKNQHDIKWDSPAIKLIAFLKVDAFNATMMMTWGWFRMSMV
jgi:hypothetical protein